MKLRGLYKNREETRRLRTVWDFSFVKFDEGLYRRDAESAEGNLGMRVKTERFSLAWTHASPRSLAWLEARSEQLGAHFGFAGTGGTGKRLTLVGRGTT